MQSPIGKVIGSFVAGGLAVAFHTYLPAALDLAAQSLLLQVCLHYGVTYGKREPQI